MKWEKREKERVRKKETMNPFLTIKQQLRGDFYEWLCGALKGKKKIRKENG